MAKEIKMEDYLPNYQGKNGAKEYIVENKNKGVVEVISKEKLEKINPHDVGSVIPKPIQNDVVDGVLK